MAAKFGSRKLMLMLAFLLINSQSITYSKLPVPPETQSGSNSAKQTSVESGEVIWLVDTANGQCLGSHGDFGECGELSLWLYNKQNNGVLLQSVMGVDEEEETVHSVSGECLGRKRSLTKSSELKMLPCSNDILSPTRWSFDDATGMLTDGATLLSKVVGPACISNGDSILQSCKKGFTSLKRVLFHGSNKVTAIRAGQIATTIAADDSAFSDVGTWKCPVTGQVFPRNLDTHLSTKPPITVGLSSAPTSKATSAVSSTRGGASASSSPTTSANRQVFMGAGVFSKVFMGMTFNVYSMGWYVEASAAQTDPSLRAYKDKPLSELQTTEDFYRTVSSAGAYDRTLFVKLAMTLKTKMLLDGFLSEIVLEPQNKAAVARASAAYTVQVCPEGLEIIFTWRVPHGTSGAAGTASSGNAGASAGASSSSREHEYLEVRIGEMYFELHEPGLAEDFMKQFFAPENPVSPSAKKGFVTFFPTLLHGPRYTATQGVPGAGVSTVPATATATAPGVPKSPEGVQGGANKLFSALRGWKIAA